MVNLVTVPNRELIKVGKYQLSTGEFEATPELIKAAIAAHESGVLRKPVIRLGHNDPRFSGDPAVGYIDNVRASDDGTTMYGDLVGVPEWLGDIMSSAYPSVSIEGLYDYTAPDGSSHDFILTGLALLGATPPGIDSLKSVQDVGRLYDIAAAANVGGTAVEFTVEHPPRNPVGVPEITQAASAAAEKKGATVALSEKLAEALGVDASADEDVALAAVAKLREVPEPVPAPEPVAPQPEQVAAAAAELGLVMVNKDQYEATVAAAAAGAEARKQQIREADEGVVMAAVKQGKIPPARKQHWLDALAADREGTATVLASLAPILPVQEIGYGRGEDVNTAGVDSELEHAHNRVMASLGFNKKVN